ncbi:MAG: bifunctional precorrin-2 dehydrogenase/sirohydrochlorin ferrochelatase [Planctomycetes bacterium]|nr:bifunctional precorrin-2 dehydrogenase/sirohydrochlorin ferrochelatase [Planctomycetota bacterium]
MAKYPIYLELAGRRAVVIGAGAVALRKVQALAETGARVTVVAEHVPASLQEEFLLPNVELVVSTYSKDYLAGATLCIAATNEPSVNQRVYNDCQALEVLCNVADQPELCDFFVPAVVKRGALQIAVGTDGNCPAYAGHLRKKLETMFTDAHGQFVEELEKVRRRLITEIPDADRRKALMGELAGDESFEYFTSHGAPQWHEYCRRRVFQPQQG